MTSLLASLPLVCQIILTGHQSITETGTMVSLTPLRPNPPHPLPEGYVKFPEDNAAYKVYEERRTWTKAQEQCHSEGAHLAVADTRQKIKHINSTKPHPTRWAHVGVHRSATHDDWVRADNGLTITSVPWAYDTSPRPDNCTIMSMAEGGLIDKDCNQEEHYVCEITLSEAREKFATISLPDGYVPFIRFGVAYKIHNESLNWNEARKQCIMEGGNLAVVDSREKNNAIVDMDRPQLDLHIGIHNMFHTAEWIRADNNFPVTFVPWARSSLDGTGRCLVLWNNGQGAADAKCQDLRPFVCEISIPM